jgi:hypothetical protein
MRTRERGGRVGSRQGRIAAGGGRALRVEPRVRRAPAVSSSCASDASGGE